MTEGLGAYEDPTGKFPVIAGKYRVIRVLGRGGMGVVYEAENSWTGRRVAVKVLLASQGSTEQTARFLQEARATATVRHPAVVDVLDMGADPDTHDLFLVQELLRGETLRERLDRAGPLSPDEAVRVVRAMLEGLEAAHAAGIVHRDIKPSNVMLVEGDPPTPKLIDFGIAKAVSTERSTIETSTGQILGTPAYMAPEQLRGERSIDGRVDVWSVGAVLYEALSGRKPFDAANYNLLVFRVLSGPPDPLREVAPGVPSALASVVDRALSPDREHRYASASAMLAALDAPDDATDASDATALSVATVAPSTVATTAPARRTAWTLAIVSLAAFAAIFAALRPHSAPAPARVATHAPAPAAVPVPAAPVPAPVPLPAAPSSPDAAQPTALPTDPPGPAAERHRPPHARPRTPAPTSVAAPPHAPVAPATPPGGRAAMLTPESAYPSQ